MSKNNANLAKATLSPNLVTAWEEISSAFAAVRQAAAVIYGQAGLGSSLFFTKMQESRILLIKWAKTGFIHNLSTVLSTEITMTVPSTMPSGPMR